MFIFNLMTSFSNSTTYTAIVLYDSSLINPAWSCELKLLQPGNHSGGEPVTVWVAALPGGLSSPAFHTYGRGSLLCTCFFGVADSRYLDVCFFCVALVENLAAFFVFRIPHDCHTTLNCRRYIIMNSIIRRRLLSATMTVPAVLTGWRPASHTPSTALWPARRIT
jgi:hypothetical protein